MFLTDTALAGGLAVGAAITLTYALKCLHPPGAATALLMVFGSTQFHSAGWQWTAWIVLANAGFSLLLALFINNIMPGRHYPMAAAPSHPRPEPHVAPERADIEWTLAQMDSVIDVSIEDLADIYAMASERAKARYESAIR